VCTAGRRDVHVDLREDVQPRMCITQVDIQVLSDTHAGRMDREVWVVGDLVCVKGEGVLPLTAVQCAPLR
jgi:hypothetical protein